MKFSHTKSRTDKSLQVYASDDKGKNHTPILTLFTETPTIELLKADDPHFTMKSVVSAFTISVQKGTALYYCFTNKDVNAQLINGLTTNLEWYCWLLVKLGYKIVDINAYIKS